MSEAEKTCSITFFKGTIVCIYSSYFAFALFIWESCNAVWRELDPLKREKSEDVKIRDSLKQVAVRLQFSVQVHFNQSSSYYQETANQRELKDIQQMLFDWNDMQIAGSVKVQYHGSVWVTCQKLKSSVTVSC